MQVRMLGPLDISSDRAVLPISGPKQRIVLALLALRRGEVVSADELIEAGWGDDLPTNPANALQYQIAQLRKLIEPDAANPSHLVTVAPGYRLEPETVTTDVAEFRASVAEAQQAFAVGDHQAAERLVESALSIWRGPALAELVDTAFADGDRARLESERVTAVELRIDVALARGQHATVAPQLAQLTTDHPRREGLWARRALALYRGGQQSEALRVLGDAGEALAEVGLDVSFELRDLERRIFQQDESLIPNVDKPPIPTNLPASPNRLIGREAAVAAVTNLLDRSRTITLLGPGGAGKTRLAIALGGAVSDRFPGGIWFAALDALDDASLLAAEVGRISSMREVPNQPLLDTLATHLGRRPTLLVLDNCEHLVDAVAALAEELMSRCAELSIVATSQVTLGTAGEVVFTVPPLTLPGQTTSIYDSITDANAVMLFVERAREAGVSVDTWDNDELAVVANIVGELDGLPLALELAAARTRSMSLDEIAYGLNDRFSTLSRGPRTAPDRQRSLLGAIEWSLGLLDDRERALIARLSVLAGGFDVEDAAAVTGEPLAVVRDDLADLVDRSLLVRRGEVAGTARFAMLESLRQHGVLSIEGREFDATRDRHLAHFATLIESADAGLCGPDQLDWLHRIDAAYENARSALSWSLAGGDGSEGIRLASGLGRYWDWRGMLNEASSWASRIIDRRPDPVAGLPSVLAWQAYGSWEYGDLDVGRDQVDRALEVARELDDPAEIAGVLCIQLLIHRSLGDLEAARTYGVELDRQADRAQDGWMTAWSASALSTVDVVAGDVDAAHAHARRSLDLFSQLGDRRGEAWALITLSQVALDQGQLDEAERQGRAALARAVELEDDRDVLWVLELLADTARRQGEFERAARLWGATRPLRELRGLAGSVSKLPLPADLDVELRRHLGPAFDGLFEQGRSDPGLIIGDEVGAASVPGDVP